MGYVGTARHNGRWWLITPDGVPFWTISTNHIDSPALRFPYRAASGNRTSAAAKKAGLLPWEKRHVAADDDGYALRAVQILPDARWVADRIE